MPTLFSRSTQRSGSRPARNTAITLLCWTFFFIAACGEGPKDSGIEMEDASLNTDAAHTADTGADAGTPDTGADVGTSDTGADAGTPDTDASNPDTFTPAPPIPELAQWEARMLEGATYCDKAQIAAAIGSGGVETEGNVWYYDGTDVYHQIAAYTGDADWYRCAGYVRDAYRSWVLAMTEGVSWPVGKLNGWRLFSQGLLTDYRRNDDAQSHEAVRRMAIYSAFAGSGGAAKCEASRETAYILNAYLAAEEAGEPRNPQLAVAVDFALGHLDGWFISETCTYLQPFMAGLTMEALMYYFEITGDDRVPSVLEAAADALWEKAWVAAAESFWYDSNSTGSGAGDLNHLIAPVYAWLWQRTGDTRHLDRGDQVFAGGVRHASFWSGKHFSQSYRSSFDYVHWRSSPVGTYERPPRYLP